MLASLVLAGLVLGTLCSAETPRVALMFATRGPMPLEDVWKQFLGSVSGMRPPALSPEQWKEVMQEGKVSEVERRVRRVGQFTSNEIVSSKTCVDNPDIMASAAALANSWKKIPKGQLSGRGAKLLDPNVPPHPVYAAQELFSLYVHVPPEFEGYTPDSVFYGREITPSTHGERFRHSLGKLTLLLLEAALNDPQVENARFVMISEADAPLYNAAVTYLELMTSAKSRVGPSRDFETLLQQDPEFSTASPLMFVAPFTKDHFSKTTQWVSLSRAAAFAVVHDRIVEPWFATFAGARWRCRFIQEASMILPDISALIKTGVDVRKRTAAMELLKYRALPPNFTQGEYYADSLPQARSSFPGGGGIGGHSVPGLFLSTVGVPSWATELWFYFLLWVESWIHADGLTTTQRTAMRSYRKQLHYKVPVWGYIPVNIAKWEAGRERRRKEEDQRAQHMSGNGGRGHEGRFMGSGRSQHSMNQKPSLMASGIGPVHQNTEMDSQDLRRKRGQIWDLVLDDSAPRQSGSGLRKLHEASDDSDNSSDDPQFMSDANVAGCMLNLAKITQKHGWTEGEGPPMPGFQYTVVEGDANGEGSRTEAAQRCTRTGSELWELDADALRQLENLTESAMPQRRSLRGQNHDDIHEHPEARNETIHKLLNSRDPVDTAVDKPYNIEWPFPACQFCKTNPWNTPYDLWNRDQQSAFLRFIFPGSASRVVNIVSDECMIKSLLNFYHVNGEEWQTSGFSSHVDWTRANNGGHPGDYTQLMLQTDPDYIRQYVRDMRCDRHTNTSYESAFQLFTAGAATREVTKGGNLAEVWKYSSLQETCVLFARKFLADTNEEVERFFTDCSQIGLGSDCLMAAGQQKMRGNGPDGAPVETTIEG